MGLGAVRWDEAHGLLHPGRATAPMADMFMDARGILLVFGRRHGENYAGL